MGRGEKRDTTTCGLGGIGNNFDVIQDDEIAFIRDCSFTSIGMPSTDNMKE